MALPVYFTGPVSVAVGGTVVTGAGVMWSGINAKQGDFISINNLAEVLITEVTDATHLKIAPWQGPAQSGAAYAIYQNYVGRVVGVAAAEDVGVMLEKLHVDGLPFILGAEETVPDPSYGDEGQLAFKPSTGQWWEKTGGVWVPSTGLTALGYGGTSATPMLIGLSPPPKVFTTQSSLAYNGARVRAASAANLNNFMEGVATYSGTTLTMTADTTGGSGTPADWLFSIAGGKGATGSTGPTGPTGPEGPQGPPGASGSGSGNVSGPTPPVVADRIAVWAGTTATNIKDGGKTIAEMATTTSVGTEIAAKAVRYDTAQNLTEAQDAQARENVYAAPFDALSYNGMQINGSMEVDQVNAGAQVGMASGGTVGAYLTDGWRVDKSGANAFLAQQATSGIPGFVKSLWIGITTPQASIGTDTIDISHAIEGYRVARLMWGTASAQPVTLGFWVKSSVAGTLPVFIVGGGPSQSASVTISAANTAQWITVTFPAVTTGVWERSNLLGIKIIFRIASNAGLNIAATNGNTFEITGVVVLPGIEAPSAARSPLIMRPYDQELVTCHRYYQKQAGAVGAGMNYTATNAVINLAYTEKRAAPTLAVNTLTGAFLQRADTNSSPLTNMNGITSASVTGGQVLVQVASGLVIGDATSLLMGGASFLSFDARL